MVECTALEMRHRCKPIGGSNPSLSAICTILCANLRFWTISCPIARCWASALARGAIMQELMPPQLYNCGSGPECNRAISTAGYSWFQASSRKSRRKAQRRFWCGADSELRGAACGAKQPFVGIDKGRCIAQRFVFNRAKCARQLRSSMPGAEARLAPQERPSSLRHLMPFRKTKILDLYFVALSSN